MIWLLSALVAGAADPGAVQAAVDSTSASRSLIRSEVPPVPASAYQKAADGEIVTGLRELPGQAAKQAWGVMVIDQPITHVWAAVNSFSDRPDFSSVSFVELQEGRSCESGRLVFQYLPIGVPFVSDRWWVTRLTINSSLASSTSGRMRELSWVASTDAALLRTEAAREKAAQAVPISFSRGGWVLLDVDGRSTIVQYHALSDPGGSLPAGITSSFASGSVTNNLEAIAGLTVADPGCPAE